MIERDSEQQPITYSPEAMFLAELSRISENPRGEPLTWGSTPLVMSADVVMQQSVVKSQIAELFKGKNVPEYVHPQLARYIEELNMARTANRENHNMNSYAYRGKTDLDGVPLEALDVLNRALKGNASPAELLLIAEVLEIPTIELASITHPYGQRIEELEQMRNAINGAVELFGGYIPTQAEHPDEYEVKGSDNPYDPSQMKGIHMTRKRCVGILPDGTEIIERSSFVIVIDNLPPAMAEKIRSIPFEEFWANKVRRAEKLYELVPLLLESNDFKTAIPVSTTVVAKNPALEERLLSEEAMDARRRRYMDSQRSMI